MVCTTQSGSGKQTAVESIIENGGDEMGEKEGAV
jgi:hypothetical protein